MSLERFGKRPSKSYCGRASFARQPISAQYRYLKFGPQAKCRSARNEGKATMRTRFGAISIFVLFAVAACGNDDAQATDVRLPDNTSDVAEALRCHDVISSAMANSLIQGDGAAVVGVREQVRWFSEAQRRAEAAGITDGEFNELAAATSLPMSTQEQRAENTPVLHECLANVPDL